MVVVFLSPHATLKANLLVQFHTYVKSASGVDSTWEGSRASSIFLVRLTFADVTWISFCFHCRMSCCTTRSVLHVQQRQKADGVTVATLNKIRSKAAHSRLVCFRTDPLVVSKMT